jgi:hypothetical protein
MSSDHRRTVLSSDADSRYCELVDGPVESGLTVEGENATANMGPECPTKRREEDGCVLPSATVE